MNTKEAICFVIGHKRPVPMFTENESCVYSMGCPYCKTPMGPSVIWKNAPAPPGSTPQQEAEWAAYLRKRIEYLRAKIQVESE